MASLKPKLFCGVASQARKTLTSGSRAGAAVNNRDACVYATILVINGRIVLAEQRLHTNRTDRTLPLFASDRSSETGDYKGQAL
ncbi:MAG TPA: hypothetical protein VIG25_03205 [Pyrinomonadaceae bacterium]